ISSRWVGGSALEPALGVHPGKLPPAGPVADQSGIVEDGSPLLLCTDDGLDVNQPGPTVEREQQLARERTKGYLAQCHRGPAAFAANTSAFQVQARGVTAVRPGRGLVKEDIKDAHRWWPTRRGVPGADGKERHRLNPLEQDGRLVVGSPSDADLL